MRACLCTFSLVFTFLFSQKKKNGSSGWRKTVHEQKESSFRTCQSRAEQSKAELCWNLSLLMFESRNQLPLTHLSICTTSWLLVHSFCMDPCSNQFRFHTTISTLSTPKKHLLPFKQSKHFHQRNRFT
jgi:hypothetical protein